MAETTDRLMVHVIRYQIGGLHITDVTKPTTDPVEVFEADARQRHPGAVMKPSFSYTPEEFVAQEASAEELGFMSIGDMLNRESEAYAIRAELCDMCVRAPGVKTCERCLQLLCEECAEGLHNCEAPDENGHWIDYDAGDEPGGEE